MEKSFSKLLLVAAVAINLVACRENNNNNQAPAANPTAVQAPQQVPKNILVRMNGQNAEMAIVDSEIKTQADFETLVNSNTLQFAPISNENVVTKNQGFPKANGNNWYFVQEPKNFVTPTAEKTNLTNSLYYPGYGYGYGYAEGYGYGYGYGFGYNQYPYYYGYTGYAQYQHFYPSYNGSYYSNYYSNYYYQPSLYYGQNYWYYQAMGQYSCSYASVYNPYQYYWYRPWWNY